MRIAVVGGGPAGLRAAEVAAEAGAEVTLYEAKPSVGRKFLVAGRGGLNLSKEESPELFASRYGGGEWREVLGGFDHAALRAWAGSLGVETFVASTGRIYPREMKAAPLLRRWVQRLRASGVRFALRHRWCGLADDGGLEFETEDGRRVYAAEATVLALGGGSWPETGSDGRWTETMAMCGVKIAPLQPANCGWEVSWSPEVLTAAEGEPLKNITVRAGATEAKGELLITRYGLEGGALYQLGPALRAMAEPALTIDLKPSFTVDQLVSKLGPISKGLLGEARGRWRLSDAAFALLAQGGPCDSAAALARAAKECVVRLTGPRPLAEAISSAGGVCWSELDESLMLRRRPGIFVAGEMIDWEAPTGGYLIHGCLAGGTRAGRAAVAWCRRDIR